jgi:hypothetical protein
MQLHICAAIHDSGASHEHGGTTIADSRADKQLHQQQTARRGVRRRARARTRLAKGTVGNSLHEACAPTQPFLHALRGGDGPPDARTTVAAITTPHPGAGCRGQRQPVPAHLVDEPEHRPAACSDSGTRDSMHQSEFSTDCLRIVENRWSLNCCMTEPVTIQYRRIR